jgi:hypothetical protein
MRPIGDPSEGGRRDHPRVLRLEHPRVLRLHKLDQCDFGVASGHRGDIRLSAATRRLAAR